MGTTFHCAIAISSNTACRFITECGLRNTVARKDYRHRSEVTASYSLSLHAVALLVSLRAAAGGETIPREGETNLLSYPLRLLWATPASVRPHTIAISSISS